MKYMLDFPGGYHYGFPCQLKQETWHRLQDNRIEFEEILTACNVPRRKMENAWLWARWYKDER